MRFEIRRATAADQSILQRALYSAWRWREPWSEAAFHQHVACHAADSYVDDFGRRPGDLGFVGWAPGGDTERWSGAASLPLATIATATSRGMYRNSLWRWSSRPRGRGLGSALIRRLLEEEDAEGVPAVSLHVASGNVRAQRLYGAVGFVVVEDRGDRGLVMCRELSRRRPS